MVRYTYALRGPAKEGSPDLPVHDQVVDIFNQEQLSERFLCDINAKGQVPVLAADSPDTLPARIPDSLEITRFLCERFPNLAPELHKSRVLHLLGRLHSINYFSLTFGDKPVFAYGLTAILEKLIADPDISDRFQEALAYKLEVHNREKVAGVQDGAHEQSIELTREVLSECAASLPSENVLGPWLFGLAYATALDAHLVVLIARLQDIGKGEIVPPELTAYADRAMEGPEWQSVMEGRRTMRVV